VACPRSPFLKRFLNRLIVYLLREVSAGRR